MINNNYIYIYNYYKISIINLKDVKDNNLKYNY